MRYIRTKYGRIFEVLEEDKQFYYIDYPNEVGLALWGKLAKDVIKEADTIEELCDEFVYEILTGEDEEPMYRDIHNARIDIKTQLKIYEDEMAGVRAIYGAIWTDKGLQFVAKMNEKGELELL